MQIIKTHKYYAHKRNIFIATVASLTLIGVISTASFFANNVLAATTITVNSTADTTANDGVCTLREAITSANTDTASGVTGGECLAGSGADTIEFAITGTADFTNGGQDGYTIAPQSALPEITERVAINGYSQPGSQVNTAVAPNPLNGVLLIEVDGSNVVNNNGFRFIDNSDSSSVRGLVINSFASGDAINIFADNIEVQGDYIGINPAGNSAKPNQVAINTVVSNPESGINLLVGGLDSEDRNLISGNTAGATNATASYPGSGWVFQGNYLGVAADGLTPITNSTVGGSGVLSIDNVSNVVVGGSEPTAINVIGASLGHGIAPDYATNLRIEGNYIGLGYDGTTVLGNNGGGIGAGIALTNSTGFTIKNNKIAGWSYQAIFLGQDNSQGTVDNNHLLDNPSGIIIDGTSTTELTNNQIDSGTQDGIFAWHTENLTIQGNIIEGAENGIRINSNSSTVSVDGNFVSGSTYNGVEASGPLITDLEITNNEVDLGQAGLYFSGDVGALIEANTLFDNSDYGLVADGTTGILQVLGNTIYGNGQDGIYVGDSTDLLIQGNTIYSNAGFGIGTNSSDAHFAAISNSIYNNDELGISLQGTSPLPNDSGDSDTGPNGLLNYPDSLYTNDSSGDTDLEYTLDVPAGNYRVEFFSSTTADPSGNGEGETFLGYQNITHAGAGSQDYSHTLSGTNIPNISATVTERDNSSDGFGVTSEFSEIAGPKPQDIAIAKALLNPEDVANEATLTYKLKATNIGGTASDLTQFDGTTITPLVSSIFVDILPPELTFVADSSSNPDITCTDFTSTVEGFYGAGIMDVLLLNHPPGFSVVVCSYDPVSGTLAPGDSISTNINVTVKPAADLKWTNYLYGALSDPSDPDTSVVLSAQGEAFGSGGTIDMIDAMAATGSNNFASAQYPIPVEPTTDPTMTDNVNGLSATGINIYLVIMLLTAVLGTSGVTLYKMSTRDR